MNWLRNVSPRAAILALLAAGAAVAITLTAAASRRGVWFCGDVESGGLAGWS